MAFQGELSSQNGGFPGVLIVRCLKIGLISRQIVSSHPDSGRSYSPVDWESINKYDVMGSFLRPEYLKQARSDFQDGKITKEELTALEDKAIRELIGKLVEHGYPVITDGEFRRGWYHSDFLASLTA